MKNCSCGRKITRWETEGLSGWKCPNDCPESHSIDQYPFDLQTQEFRKIISQQQETKKFTEIDWCNIERRGGYGI